MKIARAKAAICTTLVNTNHIATHGVSSIDKDDWRARQNRKPLKVTRKKWLNED